MDESVCVPYPALAALRLTAEQLSELAKQGSVHAERAHNGKLYYKLRFRFAGKQIVRYLRSENGFVEAVRREIAHLQRQTHSRRRIRRLTRAARRGLREVKLRLVPIVDGTDLHFHGQELRRRRCTQNSRKVCLGPTNIDKPGRVDMATNGQERHVTDGAEASHDSIDMVAQRSNKLDDIHRTAVVLTDAEQAGVRSAAGDLFEIGASLAEAIKAEMRDCGPNLRAMQRAALPGIGTLMVVHRYASRYTYMDRNWSEVRGTDHGGRHHQLPSEQSGES